MEKLQKKSQNLKLLLVGALLIITPLLSTSLRFKYLYFIVNILIIAVGAEAGLLSFFLQAEDRNRKPAAASLHVPQKPEIIISDNHDDDGDASIAAAAVKVEDSAAEPSIFFVGGGAEGNRESMEDNMEEDHELYEKSETFIGNFYKQLKMQRDESWNISHHLSAPQVIGIHKSPH